MMFPSFLEKIHHALSPRRFLLRASALVPVLVPVRRRYLLTRRGTLRLRYAAAPALAILLSAGTALQTLPLENGSAYEIAMAPAAASAPAGDPDADLLRHYDAASRRLQRYAGAPVPPVPERKIAMLAKALPRLPREKTVEIGKGDTLAAVLQEAGVSGSDIHNAVAALEKYYNPRSMKPGQKIKLNFDPDRDGDSGYQFASLKVDIDPVRTVSLAKSGDGAFAAEVEEKEIKRRLAAGRTDIEVSLYGSALKAGIPNEVVSEAIRVYSWDVDFQRDIRRGDSIEVLYEKFETEDGVETGTGEIVYARLYVNGQDIPVYRYERKDGGVDYYTADGKSIRKTLMSTPIDGARISSGYGMRKHPVLGYNKMHKGVDFAAPTGTPIFAAGDGTVEKIGRWGAYGNYVRVRHNSSVKTAYAHMSKFARGLSAGDRVKQGQVIGYVGATGRVTGAHLHYEVLQGEAQVNPKSISLPQGDSLRGAELAAFQDHIRDISRQYASLMGDERIAQVREERGTRVR